MAEERFCNNCGAPRKPSTLFCSVCGTKFSTPPTPPAAKAQENTCRRCGAPIPADPDRLNCDKCLAEIKQEILNKVFSNEAAGQQAPAEKPGRITATTEPAISAQKPTATPKSGAQVIPAVECWQIEVTRRAAGATGFQGNVMTKTLETDSTITITRTPPSPALLDYPQILEPQIEGSKWNASGTKTITQKERMAVIIDSGGKTVYYLFSPDVEFVPPIRGVTRLNIALFERTQMPGAAIPAKWARFSEGDYIKNYLHLTAALGKDYASLFVAVPMTTGSARKAPEQKKRGLFAVADSLLAGMNTGSIEKWEVPRDPGEKIATVAANRERLNAVLSQAPATTAVVYKQRSCTVCGSLLVFDSNENALFCPGCGAYVQRYGMPPRQEQFFASIEKRQTAAGEYASTSFGMFNVGAILKIPDSDLFMMKRSAFCPQCSSWLQYIYLPQLAHLGTDGNHLWYCPHCLSECGEILDRPLSIPHTVTCSHCGALHDSLVRSDVTVCPSCGSQFLTAEWEKKTALPDKDMNEFAWSQVHQGPAANYQIVMNPGSP